MGISIHPNSECQVLEPAADTQANRIGRQGLAKNSHSEPRFVTRSRPRIKYCRWMIFVARLRVFKISGLGNVFEALIG